ncbi:MAG: helix-turn-helix transcriptional regulator [Oscillospiraceae bacterium]|nr:helix-turn-helix transcriptional regulator [Oscillospiraceae bacterium]
MLEQEFSPSDSSVSLLMNKMLGYFSDNYMDTTLTVASAAAHFHMSPQQLARDFKKLVGVSPSNYLMQIRLDRAKQLLLDTSMSNEQIAAHVGFGNVKRLYRALQSSDGISPGLFRKNRGTIISDTDTDRAWRMFQNRTSC